MNGLTSTSGSRDENSFKTGNLMIEKFTYFLQIY